VLLYRIAHYKEKWEDQQAMYIGLRYPEDRKKRKRRKQSRSGKGASFDEQDGQGVSQSENACNYMFWYCFVTIMTRYCIIVGLIG